MICEPLGAFLIDFVVPRFVTKSPEPEIPTPDAKVVVAIHPKMTDEDSSRRNLDGGPWETDISTTNIGQNQMSNVTLPDRETPVRRRDTPA